MTINIVLCILMVLRTMSKLVFCPVTILRMRNWFQVLWLHTTTVTTRMINGQTYRNGTNKQLIRYSMCSLHFSSKTKVSVPIMSFAGLPLPTVVRVHVYFGTKPVNC